MPFGNPFFLPALSELWGFQEGYRWQAMSGRLLAEWDEDWLVVAEHGGDPFIFSRASEHILHEQHGRGEWAPRRIFDNMKTMAACLAAIGTVVVDARSSLVDDLGVSPKYRALAENRLAEFLGSVERGSELLDVLGW